MPDHRTKRQKLEDMARAGTPNEATIARQKLADMEGKNDMEGILDAVMDRPVGRKTSPKNMAEADFVFEHFKQAIADDGGLETFIRRKGYGTIFNSDFGPLFSSTHYADDEPIDSETLKWFRNWLLTKP